MSTLAGRIWAVMDAQRHRMRFANLRKTRFWLALTGWLPWACYFGMHHNKIVARRNIRVPLPSGAQLLMESRKHGEFHARLCVCKRCGEAW